MKMYFSLVKISPVYFKFFISDNENVYFIKDKSAGL